MLKVSDKTSCQTLLGSQDNQIVEAADFLTKLEDFDDESYSKAVSIEEGLKIVADSSSAEISELLMVMREPFQQLSDAAETGKSSVDLKAERFKLAATELVALCEPLIEVDSAIESAVASEEPSGTEVAASEDTKPPKETTVEEVVESADESIDEESGSTSQVNALETANDYLSFTAFSKKGLVEQLVYEKYSKADAEWAVDHVSVDWKEQAAKMAEQYLDYTSFSRQGLIDQLVYEGFSQEQAQYGVKRAGL
ncbi:Ltp family lipoprotein [Glutamicibacter endophyticus]